MSKALITESSLTDIANAIIAKDGGAAMTPSQMATRIENLPSGSHDYKFDKPADWPDIEQILAADTHSEFTNKIIVLYDDCYKPSIGKGIPMDFTGAAAYRTSDGGWYTTNATRDVEASSGFRWVMIYSNSEIGGKFIATRTQQQPNYPNVLWIFGNESAIFNVSGWGAIGFSNSMRCANLNLRGNMEQLAYNSKSLEYVKINSSSYIYRSFEGCTSLRRVDFTNVLIPGAWYQTFLGCSALETVSNLNLSSATNVAHLFNSCLCLKRTPELNLSSATNVTGLLSGCYSLATLPNVVANLSFAGALNYSFADCVNMGDRDSLATFSGGEITGGLAYTINDMTGAGGTRTLTLNTAIKGLFTAAEYRAVNAILAEKNWTLSPAPDPE